MVATAQSPHRPDTGGGSRPAGGGWERGTRKARTDRQNRLLHAALNDIADQLPWPPETGEMHSMEWWKRAATLQWLEDSGEQADLIVSLDGLHMAILLPHTSDLTTQQFALFMDWIFHFCAVHGVTLNDPEVRKMRGK